MSNQRSLKYRNKLFQKADVGICDISHNTEEI